MAASAYFETVQKIYIAFYQRPADPAGLKYWAEQINAAGGNPNAVITAFGTSPEATALYGAVTAATIGNVIEAIYQAAFNRAADAAGKAYWTAAFNAGTITASSIALAVVQGATGGDDAIAIANKLQVANEFTRQVDGRDLTDPYFGTGSSFNATYSGDTDAQAARDILKTVTANPATVLSPSQVTEQIQNKIADAGDPIKGQTGGQIYMLTKGLDNIPGTAGNDTIIGSIDNAAASELNTLNALDIINGGAGIDTLKIAHGGSGTESVALGNLSNVEIISIESANGSGVTVDTSTVTGVTNLNLTKAAGDISATAGTTTDVKVDVKAATTTATINVAGGKDVAVKVADVVAVGNTITVGSGTAAKGNVVVEAAAKAAVNGTNITMGAIDVTGGKTISVTQKAGDASGLVAGGTTTTHTQGAVTATANAETTTVTIKQDAAATAASAAAVAKVDEVATVTFTKLDSGQSVTVGGLSFTASKDLTAAQVAQAFANLSATAPTPTKITAPATATGDTNGGDALASGYFTGALLAKWSSAAASGSTVTFTASGAMGTDLAVSGTGATVVTTTQGVDAVVGKNTLGVAAGTVTIGGAAALATVTVDGYAASTVSAGITGGTNAALSTINLANGAAFEIDSAATTLALNLNKVNGAVDVQAGTKTLNAAVTSGATDTATLKSATAEAVNISGAGSVDGTTAAGGLTATTAINTSAMTGGKATFTIADGTVTTYTGGAGVDNVTVTNAATAITKAIDLGAGDDTLTLSGAAVAPTATLKGGDGTDTIAMTGARAEALSANSALADKIDGFEKLSITDKATAATTVNMANMDGIKYVVSKGGDAAAAVTGSKQTFVFDIAGLATDTSGSGSLSAGGVNLYTVPDATAKTATDIATAVNGTSKTINGVVYNITSAGTVITLTSATNVAPQLAITVAATAFASDITSKAVTTTPGVADVAAGTSYLTIDKIANDGTLELADASSGAVVKLADATGSTDSFNIVTKVNASDVTFGTVEVAGVETLKLNAVDTTPVTSGVASISTASLTVKADKATSLTIEGNSNVTLTLDAATNKLATIDAGTLTGKLTASASGAVAMTITGGKGADVLKASVGSTAKADVINGGDGNDTLVAGSNGAKLTGGAGNDLFVLTSNSLTVGNKESNTYSDILDFQAGDVLQLQASNATGTAAIDVTSFGKLAATLNENTAVFSDFVNAAIKEAATGQAVYFNYKGDAYVVVDSGTESTGDVFINGEDLIVKLTGVNGDNLSWNDDYATVALV